jgi:hypothetical protein
MKLLKPKWIQIWTEIIKKEGFKSFLKQKGWKFLVAFILFYLVRDSILYIIIPYFALTELGACN